MEALGLMTMVVGVIVAVGGWAFVILRAFKQGFLWVVALFIIPFAVLGLLMVDFRGTWKPLLANVIGGVILQVGAVIFVMGSGPGPSPSPAPAIARGAGDPIAVPGAYVPQEAPPVGLLESVDPMLFALLGGIGVFMVVGLLAGAVLIGPMMSTSNEGDDEPTAPPPRPHETVI